MMVAKKYNSHNKHFYFKSDGNGGVSISKTLAVMISIVTLLSFLASFAFGYGSLNNKVNNIEKCITETGPVHTEKYAAQEGRINALEQQQSAIKEKVDLTYSDVQEIKHILITGG